MNGIDLPPDTQIWHYLKYEYFQKVLQDFQMRFARPASFEDRWDGRYPASYGYSFSPSEIEALKTDLVSDEAISTLGHFVSCWHVSTEESPFMWTKYGNAPNGLAFQTTLADLPKCLSIHGAELVNYYDPYEPMQGSTLFGGRALLNKRDKYAQEKELRVWIADDQFASSIWEEKTPRMPDPKEALFVPISCPDKLMRQIVFAPGATKQHIQEIKNFCRSIGMTNLYGLMRPSTLPPFPKP